MTRAWHEIIPARTLPGAVRGRTEEGVGASTAPHPSPQGATYLTSVERGVLKPRSVAMSELEAHLRELVTEAVEDAVSDALRDLRTTAGDSPETTWRERLWRAPSEARLGVEQVCEALGCSSSFVYNRTRSDAENPLPHRKLGGSLTFVAGELRNWIRRTESVEVAGPSDPPEDTVRLHERRAS